MTPARSGEKSCLYFGTVRHRRFVPRLRDFRYRIFMVLLDLSEVDRVFGGRWLWGTRWWAPARFDRRDHLGDPNRPLIDCARELISERLGRQVTGSIRLLTHLRYFGFVMNPVSFYFCYADDGVTLEGVIAEVNNTPWGERHCYVLDWRQDGRSDVLRASHPKTFHVSPFLPMEMTYRWRMTSPGSRLSIHIEDLHQKDLWLDATLVMRRQAINGRSLATALLAYPLMTLQVFLLIYWQALKLWWTGYRYYPHPVAGREPGTAIMFDT